VRSLGLEGFATRLWTGYGHSERLEPGQGLRDERSSRPRSEAEGLYEVAKPEGRKSRGNYGPKSRTGDFGPAQTNRGEQIAVLVQHLEFCALFDILDGMQNVRMDQKTLDLQLGRFEAMKNNIPPFIRQEFVNEYNDLVDALSRATSEDLTSFRVQPHEMKHKVIGTRRAPYGGRGGGMTMYSADKYCDDDLFNRRIQSLEHYLDSQGFKRAQQPRESASKSNVHVGTMIGSAIQQGTQDSHVTINYDVHGQDFGSFISKLKSTASKLPLPPERLNELHTDIATIEVQIASPSPKKAIIAECGASIRSIFEQVAANAIANGLLPLIYQYFPK
jgi:hypothetical protein